jgi:homoserine kinase
MITVFAPATIGNIGPGFDVLGLAVKGLGDTIEAEIIPSGVEIAAIESQTPLPMDPKKNTAGIAATEVLALLGNPGGVRLKIKKGLPSGSGLGSSAASAVAAGFAVNLLYGSKLDKADLLLPVTKAEEAVSGGFFADNTAPCLLGGATITRSMEPLDVVRIGTIDNLKIILVTPDVVVLTKMAREILPKQVPLHDFVHNMANACLIAGAFARNDYALFSRCLSDVIIEPVRATLIPGFADVKKAALAAGADGMTISGSGPTVFAVTNSYHKAVRIEHDMVAVFKKNGVTASSIITEVNAEGVHEVIPS